ncbi:hypothetical protein L0664_13600 [Octadecabacter sp. G9-8]|uniref:Uncharacterized protein n=1 Tax=Octadecabacter dasysiphoniae TaxID=2909341 RepID=A0ABS9CXW0_9RHOB|nr:hypothetical protein [Octadecabacter dasysiphoniae]MCF2872105.1 hypothetical protein [Octadecabacter dasysiphoniae]
MTKTNRGDFYSGLPWVNVPPEQARAHPKGKLNLILWLIAAYFVAIGALKFGLVLSYGAGIGVAILNGIWPVLTGIGLALRVPWAIIMAMISAGLTVYALVRGLGGDGTLITLFEVIANVGILFYLLDGDRPNLIYRHRYRKYSADEDAGD